MGYTKVGYLRDGTMYVETGSVSDPSSYAFRLAVAAEEHDAHADALGGTTGARFRADYMADRIDAWEFERRLDALLGLAVAQQ